MEKILVLGGAGLVGSRFVELSSTNFMISNPTHKQLDVLDEDSLSQYIEGASPDAVVNFIAFTNVAQAEEQKGNKDGMAYLLNAQAVKNIATACRENNAPLVHCSTEYIFDGTKNEGSYTETDKPNPISWYGETKLYGDDFLFDSGVDYLLLRLSMPYSVGHPTRGDIARTFLQRLQTGQKIEAMADVLISPVFVDSAVNAMKIAIERNARGIYNIASLDEISPYDFASLIAKEFGLSSGQLSSTTFAEYAKTRPTLLRNSSLGTHKFTKEFGDGILLSNKEGVSLFARQVLNILP